jgi:two-component system, cell cycle response regulator DivK
MTIKILYIEDNDQNFYLVNYILAAKGYAVERAHDGREGIDLATKNSPDLILLDIQLPVMDGYETARELRKIPDMKTTPIIALTSYAMAGDREKALAAGCTGYIEKPINPKTFTEQIVQYLPAGLQSGAPG